ncbi:hypothetical protein GHV40_01200 [Devosia sp. D6-9]|nr:hypothetical protein GHV40_01200 [Devosia sp. D6-9]
MPIQAAPESKLSSYPWDEIAVDCPRCNRYAQVRVNLLMKVYGDIPLKDLAHRIAADRSCGLAIGLNGQRSFCSARMVTPEVHTWANLGNALHGKWGAILYCNRHLEAMKRAIPCKKPFELGVPTLVAAFGWDFPLERLPRKLTCPGCGSHSFHIEWHVPEPPPAPGGASENPEPILQLRAVGNGRLRLISR